MLHGIFVNGCAFFFLLHIRYWLDASIKFTLKEPRTLSCCTKCQCCKASNSYVDLHVPLYFMQCFYYQPNKNNLFKFISYRNLKVGPQANIDPRMQEGSSESHEAPNGSHKESKLELFGFDSLVNILGLKRYWNLSFNTFL